MYFILQTAERAIEKMFKDENKIKMLGNSPIAAFTYHNSKKTADKLGTVGGKVFFFKAFLEGNFVPNDICLNDTITDFGWITLEEGAKLLRQDYYKAWKSSCLMEVLTDKDVSRLLNSIAEKRRAQKALRGSVQQ